MLKKVAIESPYKGDVTKNTEFCQNVCKWAILNGLNPFAMHLFFTLFLNDSVELERNLGINCGLGWTDLADEVWFCLRPDDKISSGMTLAIERNKKVVKNGKIRKARFLLFLQEGYPLGQIMDDGQMQMFCTIDSSGMNLEPSLAQQYLLKN